MEEIVHECMLCCEQSKYIGLSKCNHGPFCIKCVYKMRVLSKSNACPICKTESKQLVITNSFCKFEQIAGEILPDKTYSDVLHCGPEARKQFEKLMELKCFVKINGKPCRHEKVFPNLAFLKKHLKEDHKRVMCDVCLEKKTCVLEEQKFYTTAQLNRHLERGDIDQSGNIIFMHPYCGFCKKYFFNDQEFRVHLGLQHMLCNVCGNDERFRFYSNYDSLEIHYKISHYICSDPNCLAKKFIAFRSAEQLRVHKAEIHGFTSGKRIDGKQLCGFQYGSGINNAQYIEIKDNEGIDMQEQFLAMKKSKNRALGEVDTQEDYIIDMRDFYPSGLQQDQHYHQSFVLRHKSETPKTEQQKPQGGNKKKKYVQKSEFEKQKPQIAKQNQKFYIEDLSLLKTFHLSRLYYDEFTDKLATIADNSSLKDLDVWRNKLNKRQMTTTQFLANFFNMMKKYSLKSGYQIFPHYIRTVTNDNVKNQLDQQYIKFLKKLPTKQQNLLSQCTKYSELFQKLVKEIEANIETRIISETMSIKRMPVRCKQRLYQIIGVVRRLKTQQMAKFKFASNFGVQNDTSEHVHNNIIKKNYKKIQQKLSKIPNQELLDLYVFVKYCHDAIIHSEHIHINKNKIHENILEDFLYERPELEKKYGCKKQDLKTLDEQIEYEKIEEERNHQKKMKDMEIKNKNMGYHSKTDFNLNDKGDFPELLQQKKTSQNQDQSYRDVIHSTKNKPATYQKKMNQLFPTLGDCQPSNNTHKKQQQIHSKPEKKQKSWWEQLNKNTKIEFQEEKQVVKVRKGKNKKEKWVSVKGLF